MIEEFKALYKKEINEPMSEELDKLFEKVLLEEFNDDHTKMDELIQSIVDENTPKEPTETEKLQRENEKLKQSVKLNEATILELADMMLSR